MCGIAGIWQTRRLDDVKVSAKKMADSLKHRGPDAVGIWADPAARLSLAHRRLSVIDLSSSANQPMQSSCHRYVAVYNGEIYNFKTLREDLRRGGDTFRTESDTEVVINGIRSWGADRAVARFDGMFALAIWDRVAKTLTLARDRFGEKPLYYGWVANQLVFASELKALRHAPGWTGSIDRVALTLYLQHGWIPAPWSIYTGIYKLPPGTILEIRDPSVGSSEPRPYWSAQEAAAQAAADPFVCDEEDMISEVERTVGDAVVSRTVADVPVGVFLSGGLDSSTVAALLQRRSSSTVKTYTIGFSEPRFDEARHARAVADALGTDHTELYVSSDDAMGIVPQLPHIYDEPFADVSGVPTYMVSRLARQDVTVGLTGDGGDEVFGGYSRYEVETRWWRILRLAPSAARARMARLVEASMGSSVARWLARSSPWLGAEKAMAKAYRLFMVAGAPDIGRFDDAISAHWPELVSKHISCAMSPTGFDEYEILMLRDTTRYLPDDILVKVDRASMAVSLESRAPFLSPAVFAAAWRLPARRRRRAGKWVLRKILSRLLPANLIDRPKMGFGVPIGKWLRGGLREWAEAQLDERGLRESGIVDPKQVRWRWDQHVAGHADWGHDLWVILMLQSWRDATRRLQT